MTTVLSATSTGGYDKEDKEAARLIVNEDNIRRAANSQALLPVDTAPNLKTSYETVLSMQARTLHIANVARAQTVDALKSELTEAQIDKLHKAASDRLSAGSSFATILADIETP